MSSDAVVQLHVHTDYSLLDGAESVSAVVAAAVADHAPAIAVTDHGTMGGTRTLIKAAAKAGITAIPGLEAYHVPDFPAARELRAEEGKSRFHLSLLGVEEAGYRNLMRLSSRAATEQFYFKPLVDDALLFQHTKGLVATSSCLGSRYNQLLLSDQEKAAKELLSTYRDAFDPGRFFIEVQDHGIADQRTVTPFHLRHARELGIPLLATNDCHYVSAADAKMHDALLAMQTKTTLDDPDRFRFSSQENYYRTSAQMRALFPEADFPGACDNTLAVAEMAQGMDLAPTGEYLIPTFAVPNGAPAGEYLRSLVTAGLDARYPGRTKGDEVDRRAAFELGVIEDMQFVDYFLIVADVVGWAKRNDIAVGPGRGSGAGSIIAFALDITTVDPLRYGLYFERFLNPGRRSMPDFDLDFAPSGRERVRAYVRDTYGADHVAYIATYGEMKGKSALKSAARVQGKPASFGERLSTLFPSPMQGGSITLAEAIGAQDKVRERYARSWDEAAGLRKAYSSDPAIAAAVDLATSVEGLKQQTGVHAAAVLITPRPLSEHVPLRRSTAGDLWVCEYDLHDVEDIGGLKMDFLGLIFLSIIKRAAELVRIDLGIEVDVNNLPLDDPKVYAMLAEGDTAGLFQLESPGMTTLTKRLAPTTIEHLAALVALYRPGPMGSDMHNDFADRKNGRKKVEVPHPDFKKLFKDTYGLVVFQEQVLLLSQHYAGFSAALADDLRSATGKKNIEKMKSLEPTFKNGMAERGYDKNVANTLWDLLPPFANYSFNKAHSVCYAMISYQCAWLKVNYPAQFVAAGIDYLPDDKVASQVENARSRGVEVYAPDINRSKERATTRNKAVWLGLAGIRSLGDATLTKLLAVRESGGDFASLADFALRTDKLGVNRTAACSMIAAGAFDQLHPSRKAMVESFDDVATTVRSAGRRSAAVDTSDDLFALEVESSVEVAQASFDLSGPDYGPTERLAAEVHALGFFAGAHPFAMAEGAIGAAARAGTVPVGAIAVDLENAVEGASVLVCGAIAAVDARTTKSGKTLTKITLESGHGQAASVVSIGAPMPWAQAGKLAWVSGTWRRDDFADGVLVLGARETVVVTIEQILGAAKAAAQIAKAEPAIAAPVRHHQVEAGTTRATAAGGPLSITLEIPDDSSALSELSTRLGEIAPGRASVRVRYREEEFVLPTKYSLDAASAAALARAVGARAVVDDVAPAPAPA